MSHGYDLNLDKVLKFTAELAVGAVKQDRMNKAISLAGSLAGNLREANQGSTWMKRP